MAKTKQQLIEEIKSNLARSVIFNLDFEKLVENIENATSKDIKAFENDIESLRIFNRMRFEQLLALLEEEEDDKMLNLNNVSSKIKTTVIENGVSAKELADAVEKNGMEFLKSKKLATQNFQKFIDSNSNDLRIAYAIANNTKGLPLNGALEEARKVIASLAK